MAASGALAPFLSTMLGLRAQRLQEEEAKARAQEEMMSGIGKGLGSVMEGIGTGMKKGREDTEANKLATEYFGKPVMRAKSANKGVQGAADVAASLMPGGLNSSAAFGPQFTGGKEGLAQRIELEKMRDTINKGRAADIWKQKNYDLAEKNYNLRAAADQRAANKSSYASQLMEKAPQSAKDILTTSLAVQAKQDTLMEQMQKDMANNDFDSYQQHAREMQAYQEVHKGAKLTGALKDTPPFVSAKQAKLFADTNANQEEITGSMENLVTGERTGFGTGGLPENKYSYSPLSAGPKVAPANQVLAPDMLNRISQGGQFTPQEAQQVSNVPPPTTRAAPGAPPIRVNPQTKQRITVKNGQWVDINTGQPVK